MTATQGLWKAWSSGYTGAPIVIYVGDNAPSLKTHGLRMNGSTYIGELSSQLMHLDLDEHIVDEAKANVTLVLAAKLMQEALEDLLADKYLADPINNDRMTKARAALAASKGAT